jgi:putative ABC transport system permease protein
MLSELKLALRKLANAPGFTLVALLTLGLGIGGATAIFSVVNGILLRPLPYPAPEQLVTVWEASQKQNFPRAPLPPGVFFDLQAQTRSLAALAAWTTNPLNLAGDSQEAERIEGAAVTPEFAAVLQVDVARGRFFRAAESGPGQDGSVVLSHALWSQRFGADPAILGQSILLNGRSREVVGIMPEGFTYPGRTLAWIPYAPDPEMRQRRDWHLLRVIGRLRATAGVAEANAELERARARFATRYPETDADWSFRAGSMLADAVSNIRPALLVLVAAVTVLLLIACANIANLLLARAALRQSEFAVRAALGASRRRLLGQLLTETVVLFVLGGAAGVLMAQWGVSGLVALAPPAIPRLDQVAIDRAALAFSLAVALGTALVFGLLPAWQGSQVDLTAALRRVGRGTTARHGVLRSLLVVGQVAAAVMLLVAAGLLLRTFAELRQVNLGFAPERVLTFRLDLPGLRYDTAEKTSRYIEEVVRVLAQIPGVEAAGATTAVPLAAGPTFIMRLEGRPPVTPSNAPVASYRVVTADYFTTMGVALRRGRTFGPADRPGAPLVCVINETLARKFFPNQDPIGQRLEIGFDDPPAWRQIVGIVADQKSDGLDAETPAQVFEPTHQWQVNSYSLAVRGAGNPAALVPLVRAALRQHDPAQSVHSLKPMTQLVSESLAQRYFSLVLLVGFAAVALALAVVGLYGVISYSVAQRTREFGVRLALGASSRDVLQLVLREGLVLVAGGILLGLAGALSLSHWLQSLLFGVSGNDPMTLGAVAVLLALVALAACLVPAYRATRVDPVVALRTE